MDQTIITNGALMVAGALGGVALNALRRPSIMQDKLVMAAIAAGAAYLLRQFEGRGHATDAHGTNLTALGEQVKTLFTMHRDLKAEHDNNVENVDTLRLAVSTLVAKMDQVLATVQPKPARRT